MAPTQIPPVPSDVLPLDALCARLGVDQKTVYRWRRLRVNPLPGVQPTGGRVFFSWPAVLAWFSGRSSRPARYPARARAKPSRATAGTARASK